MNGTPELEQFRVVGEVTVKLDPEVTGAILLRAIFTGKVDFGLNPEGELRFRYSKVADVAPSGNPPTLKDTFKPLLLQIAALAANGLNPLLLAVTLALGLKIPIEYRITATMTMISIAQP